MGKFWEGLVFVWERDTERETGKLLSFDERQWENERGKGEGREKYFSQ